MATFENVSLNDRFSGAYANKKVLLDQRKVGSIRGGGEGAHGAM